MAILFIYCVNSSTSTAVKTLRGSPEMDINEQRRKGEGQAIRDWGGEKKNSDHFEKYELE